MELNTYLKDNREERRYSVPQGSHNGSHNINIQQQFPPAASEDLHAWSIYRQNLNSDFTDSALGSSDKSPLPYGNFQLRDTTVQSILNHPRYGPKSPLGSNMYTYLKFGLPRVFPPNGSQRSHRAGPGPGPKGRINRAFRESNTAGSSGYDSSDNENEIATRTRPPPMNLRKYRSESDFRNLGGVVGPISRPGSRMQGNIENALKQPNSRASIAGTNPNNFQGNSRQYHMRSHSEADLLGGGNGNHNHTNYSEAFYDVDQRVYGVNGENRPRAEEYAPMPRRNQPSSIVYPNIQVHCLDIDSELRNISLQAKAGDLFAIMATSQKEGTALIETISGLRERLGGEILVNGQHVSKKMLSRICGYVPAAEIASLDPRMSVQNTLSFHAALKGPMDKSDLKEKIDVLVEDLGLTAVRSANICRLTHSEKQRLNVACQLLTQCSILVLDQTTTNMDIFDTFFLVEYLRQWGNSGRIVIMTLQPPTFEILSMCSGVLLLSGGRTIFSGSRSELPRHMGSLGYPCPPFKNPADYYLDLVTLDDLSAAALLESSARIDSLANAWERINPDPPMAVPAANLPSMTRKAGCLVQAKTICKRYMSYKQPGSLLSWISRLILAAILSLLIGFVFWDVPASDPQFTLNDRLGYHQCIMVITIWPIILLLIRDIQNDRKHAERDIGLQLYSRVIYISIHSLLSLLPSICIWLAYLLPAHSMSALYSYSSNYDAGIYIYMGYMLLYLVFVQCVTIFVSHLLPASNILATLLMTIVVTLLSSASGLMVHPTNIPFYLKWLGIISPQKWLLPLLTKDEYSAETISNYGSLHLCRNKQIQRQEIIVQQSCPPPNGTLFQADFQLLEKDHILDPDDMYGSTLVALILSYVTLLLLTIIVFIINSRQRKH